MTERIGRLAVRWLPDAAPDEARLEGLVHRLVADELDHHAFDGIDDDQLVCIRAVTVPTRRFRWDDADEVLVRDWAAAMASAVAAAAGNALVVRPGLADGGVGVGAAALRFRSLDVALVDLVVGVLTGRLDRAWAWCQLGLWPDALALPGEAALADDAAIGLATGMLLDHPHLAVAALVAAVTVAGPHALQAVGAWPLVSVVDAVWGDAGGIELDIPGVAAQAVSGVDGAGSGVSAITAGSRLAVAGRAWFAVDGGVPVEALDAVAVAIAQLAVLEVQPATAGQTATAAVVERVADRLLGGDAPLATDADGSSPLPVERPVARTAWGGLLFLLHLVPGAPIRSVLHLAGLDLLARLDPDIDPADPALLAFAGRSPSSVGSRPAIDHDPTTDEREKASALAVELLAGLLARVIVEPPVAPDEVLELVCRRDAVVEADPGWIDIVLSLDDVVVEVRAAGLDLDLGNIPWLGCVVRFRYV